MGIYNQANAVKCSELEKELIESERNREILRKRLTSDEVKYDSIGIPQLNIKQLKDTFKISDKYTLGRVVELLRVDYIDMVTALGNSLESENRYEISIASNAIRRRYQGLIDVLGGYTKEGSFIDRSTGETKMKSNKK